LLLGVPVRRVNVVVWVLAAALSAIAALLRVPIVGLSLGTVLGPGLLLRALAAAAIGRMENLPATFGAAVVLGMIEQAVLWNTGRGIVIDAVLFVVILAAFLLQGRGVRTRAEDSALSNWSAVQSVRPVPPELARVGVVRWGRRLWVGLLAALLVVVPLFMAPSRVNLLGVGLILALVGLSLLVLTGWVGQVSLGQMAFVGFGAATAGTLAGAHWHLFLCLLVGGLVGAVASTVIGLPALLVIGFQLACFHYQAWLHTESIGPLRGFDSWLNTPANHRIHHSTAARHADRNMGAVLMVWDRIFGTYATPEPNLSYGIAGAEAPRRWWEIYVQPWRSARRS